MSGSCDGVVPGPGLGGSGDEHARLAEYRRTNVYVFDMFIDADDESDGPPELWVARDHYTGELIQRLTGAEMDDFYAEHKDWVEYSGLVDELQDQLKEES